LSTEAWVVHRKAALGCQGGLWGVAGGAATYAEQLFVHDQECAEAVEVVGGAGECDVEGVGADVGADADLAKLVRLSEPRET
jgi:hypothetical protein